jgi:hypothetical protein
LKRSRPAQFSQIEIRDSLYFNQGNTVFFSREFYLEARIGKRTGGLPSTGTIFEVIFAAQKKRTRKIFQQRGFFTRSAKIKTLCFQRFVFGQQRANSSNRRREDTPRIPLGD